MPNNEKQKSPAWRQSPVAAAIKGALKHTLRISVFTKEKRRLSLSLKNHR
ncbi:hypothetical protein LJC56_06380 [Christensenellaceae bacterium OttesenSCG-928-K19]|nr:hypothetical protein [Christensenellaceae bacterium OttesenSCG-928-K19]